MRSIHEVIDIIAQSNYFIPWQNILLGGSAQQEWEQVLSHTASEDFFNMLGDKLHMHQVPYVIVTEYIDEFFRHLNDHSYDYHSIKNKIAKAYLKNKLLYDSRSIDIEINKKLSTALEAKRELINAHLRWMQAFISNIISVPVPIELDPSRCHIGQWLQKDESNAVHQHIDALHNDLHAMAQSALRMYVQEDYAYFLLLYLDILMASYKIRDLLMNYYVSKRLTSIYQDPLTRLPNYFQLRRTIQKKGAETSLLMFNIKEFSKINLLFGHATGDKVIVEVVDYLIKQAGIKHLYRIYGDEFAILFPTEQKDFIVGILLNQLSKHEFNIKNTIIVLSFYGSTAKISEHVMERCEYGLIHSKLNHGHITDVDNIDEGYLKQYAKHISLTEELRLAFLDNRIIPYFQPILDIQSGTITKYEVLMRVEDINGNILTPGSFLTILQGMYIYPEVTKSMIQKSFEVFSNSRYKFSINLSFADIIDTETQDFIIAMVKRYPDTAKRCIFELLENESIQNNKEIRIFFDLLHSYGVKLALDDFGVGFSNYDTIFQFDIDYIKIDGSLTQSILTNHKSLVLMKSIITVAQELDAKIIVEYVSSKEIFDIVKTMEIDYVQGYYIGMPSPQLIDE